MAVQSFNGQKLKIEVLSSKDLSQAKNFLIYINSLIEEDAQILLNKKLSLKKEKEWLKAKINKVKNKKEAILVAKNKNKIAGIAQIELKIGRADHVGELGVSVGKEYRSIGLGKYLMKEILKLVKTDLKPKPKIIRLSFLSTNKIAKNLYQKMNFKIVGIIPQQLQYKGKLVDEIIMLRKS